MKPNATQWAAWLSAALRFGIAPREFWRLSLREWRALAALTTSGVLDQSSFDALSARYPDDKHE